MSADRSRPRLCFRCGIELLPGGLAYQVEVRMSADFNHYIDGDSSAHAPDAAATLLRETSEQSAEQLMDQVYRERSFLCCHLCAEHVWAAATRPRVRGLSSS